MCRQVIRLIATRMVAFFLAVPGAALGQTLTQQEARAIAKEAYIYGFPLVDNYRIMYAYFVDRNNPEFKAPFNEIKNIPRVFTPEDKAVQTPNSDTPYSFTSLDLRAKPIVITLPAIEKERYYSAQLIGAYTYLGTRTTGNNGGYFLIAGPSWKGKTPKGIAKVLRSETQFVLAGFRAVGWVSAAKPIVLPNAPVMGFAFGLTYPTRCIVHCEYAYRMT